MRFEYRKDNPGCLAVLGVIAVGVVLFIGLEMLAALILEHVYNFVAYNFGWHQMTFPVAFAVMFLLAFVGGFFKGSSK
jgi:hypothetical protein